jgi:hypothetical protein
MRVILGASKPLALKVGAEGIMWWEETKASHVYAKIEVVPGVFVVFQAVGSGTEFCSMEYFLSHNIPVYEKEVSISKEIFEKIIARCILLLKAKYSLKHLLGLFIKRLVQYITKYVTGTALVINNPFKDQEKSAVCVELLCTVIDAAEIVRKAEDPEDMGMFEAMEMLLLIPGKELINER